MYVCMHIHTHACRRYLRSFVITVSHDNRYTCITTVLHTFEGNRKFTAVCMTVRNNKHATVCGRKNRGKTAVGRGKINLFFPTKFITKVEGTKVPRMEYLRRYHIMDTKLRSYMDIPS